MIVNGRIITTDDSNLGKIAWSHHACSRNRATSARRASRSRWSRNDIWRVLAGFGIGRLTDSGLPGESAGHSQRSAALADRHPSHDVVRLWGER